MSDMVPYAKNAYERLQGHEIEKFSICEWHFNRRIHERLGQNSTEAQLIMRMKWAREFSQLKWLMDSHEIKYGLDSYFQQNYGWNAGVTPPSTWSKVFCAGQIGTSMVGVVVNRKRTLSFCRTTERTERGSFCRKSILTERASFGGHNPMNHMFMRKIFFFVICSYMLSMYRLVQLNSSPEIEVFYMLLERCQTKNRKRSIAQHMKYFNFLS